MFNPLSVLGALKPIASGITRGTGSLFNAAGSGIKRGAGAFRDRLEDLEQADESVGITPTSPNPIIRTPDFNPVARPGIFPSSASAALSIRPPAQPSMDDSEIGVP